MKISIIGYSGSGKSTLAAKLGELYQIPVLFLDTVQFVEGWEERERQEALRIARDFMEKEAWVIEGNYTAFAQKERLQQSDYIVFLDFPRLACLCRAGRRYLRFRGKERESRAEGCEEKFDWEFFKWILIHQRSRAVKGHFRDIVKRYGEKVFVVHNQKQLDYLLGRLKEERRHKDGGKRNEE